MGSILAFLVAIALLVFVHEYGHYAVARWCGVRVLRFSIGFGRPLLKWTNPRTGVEWVVGWLPLGGYVRMLDERDPESLEALQAQQNKEQDKEQDKADNTDKAVLPAPAGADPFEQAPLDRAMVDPLAQAFNRKTVWQRIAIVLAGPVANLALAVLLYAVLAWLQPNGQDTVVATPPAGSPAATVGIVAGDRIVAVNGVQTHTWSELSWQLLKANVRGVPVALQVDRAGQTRSLLAIEAEQLGGLGPAVVAQLGLFAKEQRVLVRAVQPASAGERAGFQVGDVLLRVDGVAIERAGQLTAAIQAKPGQPVAIEGQRQGAVFVLQATPELIQDPANAGKAVSNNPAQGRLGLSLQGEPKRVELDLNPWQALVAGADKTVEVSTLSLLALGKMVVGQLSLEHLSGPIAIASAAGESSRLGLLPFVAFLAMVSVSLGVLNLLPIPVLDGGHLVYYLAEAVRGKPLSEAWQAMGQKVGLALLLLLTSVALFNDVQNILIN